MSACHCKFLEASFWNARACEVLHNTFAPPAHFAELQEWVKNLPLLEQHVLFQTSGSSGQAKWVALSKEALLESARRVNAMLGAETGARWCLALPAFHVGGFGVLVRAFLTGGNCQVFHSKWDPVAFSKFVYDHRCEYISLVPTQVEDLIARRCVAPDSVRAVIVGGGSLSDAQRTAAIGLGWPVLRSYGMTESASQIATGDSGDHWLKVLDGWELRLSEQGLLEWRGVSGLTAYVYVRDGEFSLEDPKVDGWFTTQDRVELRDGELRVLGRADTLVKVLGELVDVQAIEQRLRAQSGCDCVIFPIPDARRGVRLLPVLESARVMQISGFHGLEALEQAVCVEEFPKSSLGKVLRAELREIVHKREGDC